MLDKSNAVPWRKRKNCTNAVQKSLRAIQPHHIRKNKRELVWFTQEEGYQNATLIPGKTDPSMINFGELAPDLCNTIPKRLQHHV